MHVLSLFNIRSVLLVTRCDSEHFSVGRARGTAVSEGGLVKSWRASARTQRCTSERYYCL